MTIDEHIEQAKECAKGMTFHADSMGWRVTQLALAEEVERLRGEVDAAYMRGCEVSGKHFGEIERALRARVAELEAERSADALFVQEALRREKHYRAALQRIANLQISGYSDTYRIASDALENR